MSKSSETNKAFAGLGQRDAPLTPLEESIRLVALVSFAFFLVSRLCFALFENLESGKAHSLREFFTVGGLDPMNASGFTALFVLFLLCRPTRGLVEAAVLTGLVVEVLWQFLVIPVEVPMVNRLVIFGAGLGISGALGCFYLAVAGETDSAKKRARLYSLLGFALMLVPIASNSGVLLLSRLSMEVVDPIAYLLEGWWGCFPAQEVSRFLIAHPTLWLLVMSFYSRLPLWMTLGLYFGVYHERRCYSNIFFGFLLGVVAVFPLYLILPMVGIDHYLGRPLWPLGEYPMRVSMDPPTAAANLPRTCIPSMHMTWILIPFFTLGRISKIYFSFFGILAAMTLLGTLSPGVGHYSIDLIVAVPFTVFLQAVSARSVSGNSRIRIATAVCCLSMVVAPLFLLRLAPYWTYEHAAFTWGATIVFALIAVGLESYLAKVTLRCLESEPKITEDA